MGESLVIVVSLFNLFVSGTVLFVLKDLRDRIARLESRAMERAG